jgi:peptidoglycan/LPS O-acetylase OafA/YrhL
VPGLPRVEAWLMGQRDNFYDCIRALAAVLVLFTHYNGWLPGGSLGVSMFFCLSGFLICRILLGIELSPSNIGCFIFRRFMRVWPLMAFQILLVLLCMALWAPQNLPKYLPDIDGLITFTRGYRIWVGGSPAVLWTLRAEFWFYVLFPLVLCAAGKARVAGCIFGGIAIAWLSKVLIGHNHEGWLNQFGIFTRPLAKTEPFVFTLVYLDQLMYGAAARS